MKKKILALIISAFTVTLCACGRAGDIHEPQLDDITAAAVTDEEGRYVLEEEEIIEEEDISEEDIVGLVDEAALTAPSDTAEDDFSDDDLFAMIDELNASETEQTAAEAVTETADHSDLIQAGFYAADESGNELVLSMYRNSADTPCVAFLVFDKEGKCDKVMGEYTAEIKTSEDDMNIICTYMSFTDIISGAEMELAVMENEASGNCAIVKGNGEVFSASYLSPQETVSYMEKGQILWE